MDAFRYNVALALDVSDSVQGTCLRGSVLAMLAIGAALDSCSIDTFCMFAFSDKVSLIKTMEMEWNEQCVFRILAAASRTGPASADADCLHTILNYMNGVKNGYPKIIFMFTDGFGSCGTGLRQELVEAWKLDVQVIGIGLGLEQPVVDKTYYSYITAATVAHLPEAFRSYASSSSTVRSDLWYDSEKVLDSRAKELGGVWSLYKNNKVFDDLTEELTVVHDAYAEDKTNFSRRMELDICYVIDGTGSMSSYISGAKHWIRRITNDISAQMSSSGRSDDIRVACVIYRSSCCRSDNGPNLFPFMSADALARNIASVKCGGGCGPAADVIGGLKWALQYNWRPNAKKILIEMGDECPHGSYWNRNPHKHDRTSRQIAADRAVVRRLSERGIKFMFSTVVPRVRDLLRNGLSETYNDAKKGLKLEELEFGRGNISGPGDAFKQLILQNIIKEIL